MKLQFPLANHSFTTPLKAEIDCVNVSGNVDQSKAIRTLQDLVTQRKQHLEFISCHKH